jgi:hypothetical protein
MKYIGKKVYYYNEKFPEHDLTEMTVDDVIYESKESDSKKELVAILSKWSISNYGTTIDSENWHYLYRYNIYPDYNTKGLYNYHDRFDYILAFEDNLNILKKYKKEQAERKLKDLEEKVERAKNFLKED